MHSTDPEIESGLVYVAVGENSPDRELAEQMRRFGYEIRLFPSRETLCRAVAEHPPMAIIVAGGLAEGCSHLRRDLEQVPREPGPRVIFISSRGEFGARLQAVRAGADAYFTHPVDGRLVVDALDVLTQQPAAQSPRVLIVDDDVVVGAYYAAVLESVGMTVKTTDDPFAVMDSLSEFSPDLVLVDLYMPGCSGLELGAVIRQQQAYIGIPVVFLSVEDDADNHLAAMDPGADDFLTKPIRGDRLISLVTSRVRRARALQSLMTRDSLTGLLNHTRFREQLDLEVARARRQDADLSMAMLDVDHFKGVNDTHGHATGDLVLKSLAQMLRQRLRKTDIIGRYGGEEFAVILLGSGGSAAAAALDEVRRAFAEVRHRAQDALFSVTFSGGVADLREYPDAETLNAAAGGALYEAKRGGRNRIVVARAGSGINAIPPSG
ncbi:MAG: diguanylate cyclase [Armatimonadetes bacterium]|nr:diguanylate cyclase [Armatimonadota bacterium]